MAQQSTDIITELVKIISKLSDESKIDFFGKLGNDRDFIDKNREDILVFLFGDEEGNIDLSGLKAWCDISLDNAQIDNLCLNNTQISGDATMQDLTVSGEFSADGLDCRILCMNSLEVGGEAQANSWNVGKTLQRKGAKAQKIEE